MTNITSATSHSINTCLVTEKSMPKMGGKWNEGVLAVGDVADEVESLLHGLGGAVAGLGLCQDAVEDPVETHGLSAPRWAPAEQAREQAWPRPRTSR